MLRIVVSIIIFWIGSLSFQRSREESGSGRDIRDIFLRYLRHTMMNRAHFLYVYSSIMSSATRHTNYILLAFKSQPLLDLK